MGRLICDHYHTETEISVHLNSNSQQVADADHNKGNKKAFVRELRN